MGVCCIGLISLITLSCCCISIKVCKDDCYKKDKKNLPPKRQTMN